MGDQKNKREKKREKKTEHCGQNTESPGSREVSDESALGPDLLVPGGKQGVLEETSAAVKHDEEKKDDEGKKEKKASPVEEVDKNDIDLEMSIDKGKESDEVMNIAKLIDENISLKQEIENLKAQLEEFKTKWMYTFSEYENYRRRVRSEIDIEVKNRISSILENFLEAMDSIEAAMSYIQDENVRKGIELIKSLIEGAFVKCGAKKIDVSEGEPFDPSRCEVVDFIQSEDETTENKIAKVVKSGFEFNGRVIRPAKVIIWKKAASKPKSDSPEQSDENKGDSAN